MNFSGYLAPDEFWALIRETDENVRQTFSSTPVYGLSGWDGPVMMGEWAFGDGNREFHYRNALEAEPEIVVGTGDGSDPRWLLAAFRDRINYSGAKIGVSARLPDRIVDAEVDAAPVAFEVWDGPDRWWGVGVISGRAILIESQRALPEPIQLRRVTDVEPFLAGRNDWIRRSRGE